MDYCWACVYFYEGFWNVGGLILTPPMAWTGAFLKKVSLGYDLRTTMIRTTVLWELEGRKRPISGSGLMGPTQLSLGLNYVPVLEDTKTPAPTLTNAEKEGKH